MKKVLVAGGSGFLGAFLMKGLRDQGYDVAGTCLGNPVEGLVRVDLSSLDETRNFLDKLQPQAIIHTVALTSVDACQESPQRAYEVNVLTLKNIVQWVRESSSHTKLIYISTDHVYNSEGQSREEQIEIVNTYALTKLVAEDIALTQSGALCLRVNFFGPGSSYFDWLLESLRNAVEINVFRDVIFSPLYVKVLCNVIIECFRKDLSGIYNAGAADTVSKADFAFQLGASLGVRTDGLKVSSVDSASLGAPRPKNMAMQSGKLEEALGMKMPTVEECIKMAVDELT